MLESLEGRSGHAWDIQEQKTSKGRQRTTGQPRRAWGTETACGKKEEGKEWGRNLMVDKRGVESSGVCSEKSHCPLSRDTSVLCERTHAVMKHRKKPSCVELDGCRTSISVL